MKKICLLLVFLLISIFTYAFQIDNIFITVKDSSIAVSNQQEEILKHDLDEAILSYEYILTTPYFYMGGYDGVIELEQSKGLMPLLKTSMTADNFVRFPFFTDKKNTIGILIGRAGASGGSTQNVYFIDTTTGNFIKIKLHDMKEMTWIKKDNLPIGYKNYNTTFYFSSHANSWGLRPRISEVVYFDNKGKIILDENALDDIYKSEYDNIIFSDKEITLLQKNVMIQGYRKLGKKLVDFVYYGLKLGKEKEVFDFLKKINPIYTEEANYYIDD